MDADGDGAGSPVTEKFTYEAIDGEIGTVGDLDISQWNAWADLDAVGNLNQRTGVRLVVPEGDPQR